MEPTNEKSKSYPKFLHLLCEIFATDDHLPKQVSSFEGFEGQQILSEHSSWTTISSAKSEMREWKPGLRY